MGKRTMTTAEFGRLSLAERKRLVGQGWDILRFEYGRWQRREPVIGRGVESFAISEIVEAKRDNYGSYKSRGKPMLRRVPKGTRGRFVAFSKTGATLANRGWPELSVLRKDYKVIRKEYRIETAIWGKKK